MHRDTKDTYEQAFKTLLSIKNINGRMYEPQVFHFLLFFFFFFFFRATCAAYGISQASGWIRAAAGSLYFSHSNQDLSCIWDLYHSSWQCWIFNPLSETRDWTHILMVTHRVHHPWATTGIPKFSIFHNYLSKEAKLCDISILYGLIPI